MKEALIKIYGHFEIANTIKATKCLDLLHTLCEEWYLNTETFTLDVSMIHISYEGDYFPFEETAEILARFINEKSSGKMDVIDLEAWTLERFFLDKEHNKELCESIITTNNSPKHTLPYSRKSSLNHALEASQEKNGAVFIHKSS